MGYYSVIISHSAMIRNKEILAHYSGLIWDYLAKQALYLCRDVFTLLFIILDGLITEVIRCFSFSVSAGGRKVICCVGFNLGLLHAKYELQSMELFGF